MNEIEIIKCFVVLSVMPLVIYGVYNLIKKWS